MSIATFRFRDHEEFHRAALHMTVAGALGGLAAHVAGLAVSSFGPLAGPWGLAVLLAACGLGALDPKRRQRLGDLSLISVVAVVAGLVLLLAEARSRQATLGAAAFALGWGVLCARGLEGWRALAAVTAGAVVTVGARLVLTNIADASLAAHLPPWVVAPLVGAAFALVCAVALVARHIDVGHDRVEEAFKGSQTGLVPEMADLCVRARGVWDRVDVTLEPDSPVRAAIEDSVIRLFEVARRWRAVEAEKAATPAEELNGRVAEIDKKLEKTTDPVARGQYEQAKAALAEQLRYLGEISTARERVVARMHNYLAAMERLRLAVLNHRSADASRLSAEVKPILADLESLGKDIDCTREALDEMERDEEKSEEKKVEARPAVEEKKEEAKPTVEEKKEEAKPAEIAEKPATN